MTLLLLLSALLSALTGAGSAERAPQLAVAVSRQVEARAEADAAVRVAGARPVVDVTSLAQVAFAARSPEPPATTPLGYGERHRE